MSVLKDSVIVFLSSRGFLCTDESLAGAYQDIGLELIGTVSADGKVSRKIVLVSIIARSPEEAEDFSCQIRIMLDSLRSDEGNLPIIITEDRWNRNRETMQKRLLAHLEIFFPVYARNCEVRRIDKSTAATFLKDNHSYGDAACRYRYGLYIKRHTGHLAATYEAGLYCPGTLAAVATFSNARKWIKGDKAIRSYEWTRYASLPGIRVTGGIGKLLETFIEEVRPDDIMSYADLEWSEGRVYEQLGFTLEGRKDPVMFMVDDQWRRFPVKPGMTADDEGEVKEDDIGYRRLFQNFGSRKYRLKLTEYDQSDDE